jgi:hypothetical protein
MTRKSSWTNPDGLVVGFGANFAERIAGGVTAQKQGHKKTARLSVDLVNSTLGSSGAKITIPAGSMVTLVGMKVTEAGVGGTSIAFGDAGSTGGWITAAQGAVANLLLNAAINAQGAYAFTATEGQLVPKVYAAATDLYITAVGTFTAGKVEIWVEYM